MKEIEYIKELKYGDKTYKVNYLQEARHKRGRGEFTIAYIKVGKHQIIAKGERSKTDRYNDGKGKEVASGRLLKKLKRYYKIPTDTNKKSG